MQLTADAKWALTNWQRVHQMRSVCEGQGGHICYILYGVKSINHRALKGFLVLVRIFRSSLHPNVSSQGSQLKVWSGDEVNCWVYDEGEMGCDPWALGGHCCIYICICIWSERRRREEGWVYDEGETRGDPGALGANWPIWTHCAPPSRTPLCNHLCPVEQITRCTEFSDSFKHSAQLWFVYSTKLQNTHYNSQTSQYVQFAMTF